MLSVVITTWNEEHNLPRAVASVKKLADDIVVVDTESTDNTVEVAKKLGCRVFHHKNTGIVEPVRNFSIEKAKGGWVLLLDADEEIPATLATHIQKLLEDPQADYYRLPRKNMIFGKWIESSHWWPDYVYRLFKKGNVKWEDKIHGIPFTSGNGSDVAPKEDLAIVHHHYSSISQFVDRLNRYTDHQVSYIQSQGYNFSWKDVVTKPVAEFIRQYYARRGYKDGLHGLALSGLQAFSELVLYLKLWQESGFMQTSVPADELQEIVSEKTSEYQWWKYEAEIQTASWWKKPWVKIKRKVGL